MCQTAISESQLRQQYQLVQTLGQDEHSDDHPNNRQAKITVDDARIRLSASLLQGGSSSSNSNWKLCYYSLTHLFHKSLLKRTIVVSVIWFTLSFGSYGMSTWITVLFDNIGMTNPYADSFIFALANLPGNLVSIYFIDYIGRRLLLSMGLLLASVSSLIFAWDLDSAIVVVSAAAMFNAFSVMAWNSLDCIAVEIFPTKLRTSAMGLLASMGRIGAVVAQFVNGSLQSNMVLLLLVTSICMFIGGCAAWFLEDDTTGHPVVDEDDSAEDDQQREQQDNRNHYDNNNHLESEYEDEEEF